LTGLAEQGIQTGRQQLIGAWWIRSDREIHRAITEVEGDGPAQDWRSHLSKHEPWDPNSEKVTV